MVKNYFKIAWRNLLRHKGYSFINIAGLAVGIAACLLIFVIVRFELSFDTFHPNYNQIYRVVTHNKTAEGIDYQPGISVLAPDALKTDLPEIEKIAALHLNYGSQITVLDTDGRSGTENKYIEETGVVFIESSFFDLFNSKWIAGKAAVLSQPDMVVLNKSSAIKYFGDWTSAVGRYLKMDNSVTLKVAGIIEDAPSNSDFSFKVLVSYPTLKQHADDYGYTAEWNTVSSSDQVYILLPENVPAGHINALLKTFTAKYYKSKSHLVRTNLLQPLSEIHFDTRYGNTIGNHVTNKATLWTLSLIGFFILIMASINFVNLSTALAVGRSKEVGIRKVLGGTRPQLIAQVMGETFLVVLLSVLIAIFIAQIALPHLKNVASVPETIGLFSGSPLMVVGLILVIILVVTVLSGCYPALILSGFQPVLALKSKINSATVGGISMRRVLVVTQFAISQVLIIGTIVAISQMNFVHKADLGYNKEAVFITPNSVDSASLQKMETLKQQLLQIPGVQSVSFAFDAPSSENNWATNFYFNHSNEEIGFHTFLKMGDADYFKTFGLQVLAGRGFAPSDTIKEVVANETLINKLGIQNPADAIGKTIRLGVSGWHPIVGVVKDFQSNSLREEMKPILVVPRKQFYQQIGIKLHTTDLSKTTAAIKKLWEATYPDYVYTGNFLDDNIARFYQQENQLALVYKIFAAIAIFISCLGLYGLVSFMALQKTKEVGVRKVLGASVRSIVFLFSKEFTLLITIAFVIAVPVAWIVMNQWLQNFAYRIELGAPVFLLAAIATIFIAWITVGYKALKAALANPVNSLRSE